MVEYLQPQLAAATGLKIDGIRLTSKPRPDVLACFWGCWRWPAITKSKSSKMKTLSRHAHTGVGPVKLAATVGAAARAHLPPHGGGKGSEFWTVTTF